MSEVRVCARDECDALFQANTHNQIYCSHECKREADKERKREYRAYHSTLSMTEPPEVYGVDDSMEDPDHVEFLRKENQRLSRLAEKRYREQEELVHALREGMERALSRIDIKPVRPPKPHSGGTQSSEEIANPVCTDWHDGKRTPTFNPDVLEERVHLFADKVIRLTDIQRTDHPVNGAHLYMLGDMMDGEQIFPSQPFQVTGSLFAQMSHFIDLSVDFIRRLLSHFEYVKFVGVPGNHTFIGGRKAGVSLNPETNFDRMAYQFLSKVFDSEPRVSFQIPQGDGETGYYTVDRVGRFGQLLVHGNQFGKPTSYLSYARKILGWKAGAIPEDFNSVVCGHWHQNAKQTFDTVVLRMVGSPESDNLYAQELLGARGRPSQHMQFISPKRGVTAEYDCYLDEG